MNSTTRDSTLVEHVVRGYRTDAHVRMRLPGGGAINIDRKLPFLLVYRQPPGRPDDGTAQLVLGEASYLIAAEMPEDEVAALVRALAVAGTAEFGSFLIMELWAGDTDSRRFVVRAPMGPGGDSVEALRSSLEAMPSLPGATGTVVHPGDERHAPDMPPLLSAHDCWEIGCLLIGLEVPPLYRDEDDNVYPVFLRRLRSLLSPVLRQTVHAFARVHTTADIGSYRALGPVKFGDAVFRIDEELADIEKSFELLLLVSPHNSAQAWRAFRDGGCDREPRFHYRLLPVDPDLLRRRLYNLPIERVADPAMAFILSDKRNELDRQITLLAERNTSDFRYASMRLYQPVDDVLLSVARQVLDQVRPDVADRNRDSDERETVGADEFAALARAEIEQYRGAMPDIAATVRVRPDLTGLMVSRGNLLIGDTLALRPERVEALLHHEVGTHVLTWYNGTAQPLRQLASGLAGYDELQEGLAVLSEYLADALDAPRLRLLAARVVAAHSVEHGAGFLETYRMLTREYGFSRGGAFDICERVHASGGFTRDLIYLRGLLRLMEYLRAGGEIEPLYIGKIAAKHVDVISELRERGFLREAPLIPGIFNRPGTAQRIAAVRNGLNLVDLVSSRT
jgi:uncharacterized protein (TIGR02421 family)